MKIEGVIIIAVLCYTAGYYVRVLIEKIKKWFHDEC